MKVAVFLTGRLSKHYVYTYRNILNTFKDCEIDFFVMHCCKDEELINKMKELYKPVLCQTTKIEDYSFLNKIKNVKPPRPNIFNVVNMFNNRFTLFNVFEKYCQENNKNYGLVVSYRFDLHAKKSQFSMKKFYEQLQDNSILIPRKFDWGGLNDQMAIGRIEIMKKYFSLFEKLPELLENQAFHAETLLKVHVNNEKIKVKRFWYNYKIIYD